MPCAQQCAHGWPDLVILALQNIFTPTNGGRGGAVCHLPVPFLQVSFSPQSSTRHLTNNVSARSPLAREGAKLRPPNLMCGDFCLFPWEILQRGNRYLTERFVFRLCPLRVCSFFRLFCVCAIARRRVQYIFGKGARTRFGPSLLRATIPHFWAARKKQEKRSKQKKHLP